MYKDLITQIAKYLKKEEIYYPYVNFYTYNITENYMRIHCYLYLVSSLEDKMNIKFLLLEFYPYSDYFTLFIDTFENNDNIYFFFVEKSDNFFYPKMIFLIDKNRKFKIFNYRYLFETFFSETDRYNERDQYGNRAFSSYEILKKYIFEILEKCDESKYRFLLPSFVRKISKKNIKLIKEGFSVIDNFLASDIFLRVKIGPTEEEKKYIQCVGYID